MAQRVAVLGTGKMGEALLSGMLRSGTAARRRRRHRAPRGARATLRERYAVEVLDNAEAARWAETLILTVKPQDMGALLDELAPHVPADRLVVTAAAGITTAFIECGWPRGHRSCASCPTRRCSSTRR